MTKGGLHELVDALPEESLDAAAILLTRAQEPVNARLEAADVNHEPFTAEDRAAIEDARSEPGIPWSAAKAELAD